MNDLALIEVVLTRGLGGKELYDDYLSSDTCPLYFAETGKPVYRKHKEKWLREFLQDKPPLLARLTYLVHLVVEGDHVVPPPPSSSSSSSSSSSASHSHRRSLLADSGREIITRSHHLAGNKRKLDDDSDELLSSADHKRARLDSGTSSQPASSHLPLATRPVTRDSAGNPILPITIKGVTIHELGVVVWDRPNYHARNYIWPVGFRSTRKLPSIKNPAAQVTYTSLIIDNGDTPGFQVIPEDAPELAVTRNTASRAWMEILKMIKKKQTVSVSGPEVSRTKPSLLFIGLSVCLVCVCVCV
jgi:hypothetical protein